MGQGNSLLRKIDQQEGSSSKLVDKMFKKLDKDGNGFLEGEEYTTLMDLVLDYITKNYEDARIQCDRAQLRVWVRQTLDPDKDLRVSKDELKSNLKRLLDAERMITMGHCR